MKQRFGIARHCFPTRELIIVEEPTGRLGSAEAIVFLNLLSSIGSDVREFFHSQTSRKMYATLPPHGNYRQWAMLLEGPPAESLEALKGKIWSKVSSTDERTAGLEERLSRSSLPTWRPPARISYLFESMPRRGFLPGLLPVLKMSISQSCPAAHN